MSRSSFNEVAEYRGGAITEPRPRRRYPCFAGGCPMPGTIFTGSTDETGTCAWHYAVPAKDIPRVTQVLRDWACVSYEVNEARRVMCDTDTGAKVLQDAFERAWERLQPLVKGEWEDQLKPGTIQTRNRFTGEIIDSHIPEGYADWAKRLERFIGARVVEVQNVRHREAA